MNLKKGKTLPLSNPA